MSVRLGIGRGQENPRTHFLPDRRSDALTFPLREGVKSHDAYDSLVEGSGFEPSVPLSGRCVLKTIPTDPRLLPRERKPTGGTEGSNPARSSRESGTNLIFGDESHR